MQLLRQHSLVCVEERNYIRDLPLSRRTSQTSLGTTRFFLSIHLPHLSCMIPCSYWALTCTAALPSCITSYAFSVRQTRDLPVSSYVPPIRLPSDSRSPSTPLPSAISFPLPGGFGTLTLEKRAPLGAQIKRTDQILISPFSILICNPFILSFHSSLRQTINDVISKTAVNNNCRNDCKNDSCKHLTIICVIRSYELR